MSMTSVAEVFSINMTLSMVLSHQPSYISRVNFCIVAMGLGSSLQVENGHSKA